MSEKTEKHESGYVIGCVGREGAPLGSGCALGAGAVWSRDLLQQLAESKPEIFELREVDGRLELWAAVDARGHRVRHARPFSVSGR